MIKSFDAWGTAAAFQILFKGYGEIHDKDEFTQALGEILQSSDTLNLIAILYAKAKAINNE